MTTWIAPKYRKPPEPDLPEASLKYRVWLREYALHLCATSCKARGYWTFTAIRDELYELGLLDGWDRNGDMWLAEVARFGGYHKVKGSDERWEGVSNPARFPLPAMPPPPVTAPTRVELPAQPPKGRL